MGSHQDFLLRKSDLTRYVLFVVVVESATLQDTFAAMMANRAQIERFFGSRKLKAGIYMSLGWKGEI